jgi:pimeloyl-ACP methyl ester carboxylesterase
MQEGARMAAAALPGSEIALLPGQGHAAMSTGPRIFLDAVIPFLDGRSRFDRPFLVRPQA